MRSHSSAGRSTISRKGITVPALLTRISTVPKRARTSRTIACTEASSVTSTASGSAAGPISEAAFRASASERDVTTTDAPSAARAFARPFPSPRLDPVTIAILFLSRMNMRAYKGHCPLQSNSPADESPQPRHGTRRPSAPRTPRPLAGGADTCNNQMKSTLKGILPAIISPCDERDVFLEDTFSRLATSLYRMGRTVSTSADSPATASTCALRSESGRRSWRWRRRGRTTAASSSTWVPPIPGTPWTWPRTPPEAGADAISCMPPTNRNHAQLLQYYGDVAKAAGIPMLIRSIDHEYSAFQKAYGKVPSPEDIAKQVTLPAWRENQPVGKLFPENNILRIREIMPYLNGENYVSCCTSRSTCTLSR